MDARGQYTREEIFSQPEAWLDAITILKERQHEIGDFADHAPQQQVIFTGCGSTYYLSLAAAVLFEEVTGLPARAIPASELWLSPQSYYHSAGTTTLIAISRSGETSETLRACELFSSVYHGRIASLVCDPDSSLAKMGILCLAFPSGMEKSVAQTRAFSTLYLGTVGLSLSWAHRAEKLEQLDLLAGAGRRILQSYSQLAESVGNNLELDRVYFLGSGGRYGLACELNLKMKEMSLTHSEAFHFMEFRHGPKAMVNPNTLVVGLVSETQAQHELAVLEEVQGLGAEIISMGENTADILFNSEVEEVLRNTLYLPFGQMLAFDRSIAKGFDPDHPKHLDQVVKLAV